MRTQLIWVVVVLLIPVTLWADVHSSVKLGKGMKYFAEGTEPVSFINAVKRFDGSDFSIGESDVLSFGYSSDSYWFHEQIQPGSLDEKAVLVIGYPLLDHIELYLVQNGETVSYISGDARRFDERPIESPNFVFPVALSNDFATNIYLKVRGIYVVF